MYPFYLSFPFSYLAGSHFLSFSLHKPTLILFLSSPRFLPLSLSCIPSFSLFIPNFLLIFYIPPSIPHFSAFSLIFPFHFLPLFPSVPPIFLQCALFSTPSPLFSFRFLPFSPSVPHFFPQALFLLIHHWIPPLSPHFPSFSLGFLSISFISPQYCSYFPLSLTFPFSNHFPPVSPLYPPPPLIFSSKLPHFPLTQLHFPSFPSISPWFLSFFPPCSPQFSLSAPHFSLLSPSFPPTFSFFLHFPLMHLLFFSHFLQFLHFSCLPFSVSYFPSASPHFLSVPSLSSSFSLTHLILLSPPFSPTHFPLTLLSPSFSLNVSYFPSTPPSLPHFPLSSFFLPIFPSVSLFPLNISHFPSTSLSFLPHFPLSFSHFPCLRFPIFPSHTLFFPPFFPQFFYFPSESSIFPHFPSMSLSFLPRFSISPQSLIPPQPLPFLPSHTFSFFLPHSPSASPLFLPHFPSHTSSFPQHPSLPPPASLLPPICPSVSPHTPSFSLSPPHIPAPALPGAQSTAMETAGRVGGERCPRSARRQRTISVFRLQRGAFAMQIVRGIPSEKGGDQPWAQLCASPGVTVPAAGTTSAAADSQRSICI